MLTLGIDIGGSGIKGAVVNTVSGELVQSRYRLPTPEAATPEAVIETTAEVVKHFGWHGTIGCGFPAVVKHGEIYTAANISSRWIGLNATDMLQRATDCPCWVLNDADAAGIAEMRFGAGRERSGLVLMLTVGTGIGTALFIDGRLVPNSELGHIEIRGKEGERRASDATRERKGWSWAEWAEAFDEYLDRITRLIWPDLIVIGGGASKHFDKYAAQLQTSVEIQPARLRNNAGIVGAALAAAEQSPTIA
jgi:polyphosphate glucokinase